MNYAWFRRFLIFFVQKLFLTKNYFLTAEITLTTWGQLYTCLVLVQDIVRSCFVRDFQGFTKIEVLIIDSQRWNCTVDCATSGISVYRPLPPSFEIRSSFFNALQIIWLPTTYAIEIMWLLPLFHLLASWSQ